MKTVTQTDIEVAYRGLLASWQTLYDMVRGDWSSIDQTLDFMQVPEEDRTEAYHILKGLLQHAIDHPESVERHRQRGRMSQHL